MKRILLLMILILLPAFAFGETLSLSKGSRSAEVHDLQARLISLELLNGNADGIYGSKTAAAVSEAQRLLIAAGYDLKQTGNADEKTLELLFLEEAQDALRTLRRGSKGARVRALQSKLLDLKLLDGYADGAYGAKTEEAVRAFQNALSIEESGAASPEVLRLLESDLSAYFSSPIYYDESDPLSLIPEELYAQACILIDAPSGNVLFESNADQPLYPASTTKIMTLLLALENGNLDDIVTIPSSAAEIPKDSSIVPVYPNEQMSMRDLLYGLMIRSGNDAANAVAELCSGSIDAFVEAMNAKAEALGMDQTHFVNPHGYHDPNHITTARDLAVLTRQGLTDPTFCEIVTCLKYTMEPTRRRDALLLTCTHEIFDPASPFFIEGAAGVKSGYTSHAGFCYVGAAQRGETTLIAVLLNVPGRDRAWTDLKRLFAYGFAL